MDVILQLGRVEAKNESVRDALRIASAEFKGSAKSRRAEAFGVWHSSSGD